MSRPRLRIKSFRPRMKGIERALGELEARVMDHLWDSPSSSVREVWQQLSGERPLAYTTVMTTMDRLFQKGLLRREKAGKAFRYRARFSRQEFEELLTEEVLRGLTNAPNECLLSAFLDLMWERDPGSLDRLEQMIREKRGKK
jgi:predicted transcriptional regulator